MTIEEMARAYRGGSIPWRPGADDAITLCAGRFRMGLASGSPQLLIEAALAGGGWTDRFEVVLSSDDVARGKPSRQVCEDFKTFVSRVESELPKTRIVYIPIKPSLARWKLWPTMREANSMIQRMATDRSNLDYADTATPMLGDDGKPRPELFIKDGLHLSDAGYELWTSVVSEFLNGDSCDSE